MNKSVKKNYIYNLIYQIIVIILPIIMTPYLARTLGAKGIGIYGYTNSIITYFVLFGTLGMNLYGQREIAFYQNDFNKRSKIFNELLLLRFLLMVVAFIIFIFVFCINNEYNLYYKILIIELLANMLDITWYFQGIEDFKKLVFRNIIVKLFTICSVFLFVKNANHLWIYILIYSLSNLLGNILLWYNVKNIVKIKLVSFKAISNHFKLILTLFIPQIAIQVYAVLDKTMIGLILKDMAEVGFYEQSQKIIRILLTLITSLGIVLMPRIANCYYNKKSNEAKKYIDKSLYLVFMIAFPLMFGIIIVSKNFVPLFFGSGYDNIKKLLPVMSLIIIPVGISNITGNAILIPKKMQKQYTNSVIVGAIINLILNYILINLIGTLGAVIATVIAETLITIFQLYYCREEINFLDLLNISKNYFIAGLLMFVCCLLLLLFVKIDYVYVIIMQVVLGAIIYALVLFILKDETFIEIIKIFINRIIWRKK